MLLISRWTWNSSRWRNVESKRQMAWNERSYYLSRAVEAWTDVRCARKGFPMMLTWWYRWVGWQTIAKTYRTVQRISNRRFFCGLCGGWRWTWTIAAIHSNGFVICLLRFVVQKTYCIWINLFNYTMCGEREEQEGKRRERLLDR